MRRCPLVIVSCIHTRESGSTLVLIGLQNASLNWTAEGGYSKKILEFACQLSIFVPALVKTLFFHDTQLRIWKMPLINKILTSDLSAGGRTKEIESSLAKFKHPIELRSEFGFDAPCSCHNACFNMEPSTTSETVNRPYDEENGTR